MIDGCFLNGIGLEKDKQYTPKDEAEEQQFLALEKMGTCRALRPAVAPVSEPVKDEELADVPGIGKTTLEKLQAKEITTKKHLIDALKSKEEELKDVLGINFEKIKSYLEKK